MTYKNAYSLATWCCLNGASDDYFIDRWWHTHGCAFPLEELRKVLKCVSKDRQMIDVKRLKGYFPE